MKRLIALVLLVAVIGTVYGGVMPQARQSRSPVNLPLGSVYQAWVLPFQDPVLCLVAPLLVPYIGQRLGGLALPRGDVAIPVPPICNLTCRLRPVQGIVQ